MIFKKVPNPKKSASKAKRISGLSNYIAEPAKQKGREKCIHFRALGFVCKDLKSQQAEMLALATDATRSPDPINHYVLSWRGGERPTLKQADEAALMFVQHLGLTGHQAFYGLHVDTDNTHMHVMVNRVHPDSGRVVEINKGFDKKAGHEAIAKIEQAQGWSKERNRLYDVADGKVIKRDRHAEGERQPTAEKRDREQWTGEQSAERIAITDAGPIIRTAQTWPQLHKALARLGMRYARKGSGALIFVGEIGIKASNVDRGASFTVLQRRLGAYQERSSDCVVPDLSKRTSAQLTQGANHVIERSIDSRNPFDHILHLAEHRARVAADRSGGLHELPTGRVDGRQENSEVLLPNAQQSNVGLVRTRKNQDVRRAGTGKGSASERVSGRSTGRAAQPLKEDQPAWTEYIAAREVQRAEKKTATEAIRARHNAESAALFEGQKAERHRLLSGGWKGRGAARNALQSVVAVQHAAAKANLRARQRHERNVLWAEFVPLPQYRDWAELPRLVQPLKKYAGPVRVVPFQSQPLADTLRSLTRTIDRRGITYDIGGHAIFRDEGKTIAILDLKSDTSVAAALATAQQKFGNTLTLTGSPAAQRRIVAVSVAQGLYVTFSDPALDEYRQGLKKAQATQARIARVIENMASAEQRSVDRELECRKRYGTLDTAAAPKKLPEQIAEAAAIVNAKKMERGTQHKHIPPPSTDQLVSSSKYHRDTYSSDLLKHEKTTRQIGLLQQDVTKEWDNQRTDLIKDKVLSEAKMAWRNTTYKEVYRLITPKPVLQANTAPAGVSLLVEREKEKNNMATQKEHDLVTTATLHKSAQPSYKPSIEELKAIDEVLIEQAREQLEADSPAKCNRLKEVTPLQMRHGTQVGFHGDRAIYHSGRDLFVAPVADPIFGKGKENDQGLAR